MFADRHQKYGALLADVIAAPLLWFVRALVTLTMWFCVGLAWSLAKIGFAFGRARGPVARFFKLIGRALIGALYGLFFVLSGLYEPIATQRARVPDVLFGRRVKLGQEVKPPGEMYHVDRISASLIDKLASDYDRGNTGRDAHRKHHALLKARFEIEPDLDKEYAVGLFGATGAFDAWIRFSNASSSANPDASADVRGIAIKLCSNNSTTHGDVCSTREDDLLLVSEPVFPTHTVGQFAYLIRGAIQPLSRHGIWFIYVLLAPWRWYVLRNILAVQLKRHRSLLDITYHSVTPYRLGHCSDTSSKCRAVKYILKPQSQRDDVRKDASSSFLRSDLRRNLARGEFRFDFYLHEQADPYEMPVERPGLRWSEKRSQPVKVATLVLLQQRFDRHELASHAENITFSPWRCREEHKPIGGINRAREIIYKRIASYRHERNELSRSEPTCAQLEAAWQRAQR